MSDHTLIALSRRVRVLVGITCALVLTFGLGNSSCHPVKQTPSMEDGTELDSALRGFHKNMRWARYEEASQLVADSYKPTFMGRYEEHGEDLHITLLEIRDVQMNGGEKPGDLSYALVEVEQEWYKEPNMTVKKDRFMERWESTPGGWRLVERIERDEWREREKQKKQKALESSTQAKATPES